MCIRALFTKSATTLGLLEQAFWRVSFFIERNGASSFEVIFAWPSKNSSMRTSGFRRFLSCRSHFINMAAELLSLFFLDHYLVVIRRDDVHTSTFPHICYHSWSCGTSILKDAIFHKMSYCKFLWGNPCKAIATFSHWGFYLWDFGFSMVFRSLCCMKKFWDGFGCVIFARFLTSWRKLQLSLFTHCPLISHCQQSLRNLCTRCFVPWFQTTTFAS